MATIRQRAEQKTHKQIMEQMERIYRLYTQGYGTTKMLHKCEDAVYVIVVRIEY